ncbi:20182_t:CDS:1, partial [Dentiscutata erythropus]
ERNNNDERVMSGKIIKLSETYKQTINITQVYAYICCFLFGYAQNNISSQKGNAPCKSTRNDSPPPQGEK